MPVRFTRMFRFYRTKHPSGRLGPILFYDLCRGITGLVLCLCYRYRAIGAARVPRTGALLIVANHQSFLDPPIVGTAINRHLDYIARVGLFKSRALAWLIRTLHALPIRQDQPDSAAMKESIRRLEQGAAVLVFPEGSRSEHGELGEFKRGVAILLRRAKCPVIPVALDGAFEAWPRRRRFPRPWGRITVKYGTVISPEELLALGPDAAVARLQHEVEKLLGEIRAGDRRAVATMPT